MYIILKNETRCSHEGTSVTRINLDSRDSREGFVTHVYRDATQIADAIVHMSNYQKSRVLDDIK